MLSWCMYVVWMWCTVRTERIKMVNECFNDLKVHCEVVKKNGARTEKEKKSCL